MKKFKGKVQLFHLVVKCRTFIQENRAVKNVILSQILTAFLNFTIVKTPQASKLQQILKSVKNAPKKVNLRKMPTHFVSKKSSMR